MDRIFQKSQTIVTMLCMGLLLSACVSTGQSKNSIEQRAMDRWSELFNGDMIEAYEYLSPGYRSSVSLQQYMSSLLLLRVKWTGARYIESECAETSCKVKISLDFTVHGAVPGVKSFDGTQEIDESWVKVDGNWYFVPNK
jgi:hypothetical protein